MRVSLLEKDGARIVVCEETIARIDDALDLVSTCIERESNRVLIDEKFLPANFFELRSGFSGELLQKLANYRLRVAAFFVTDPPRSERLEEFLREARRGRDFRAFTSREDAEAWLASG
jgi:hypothetical protein